MLGYNFVKSNIGHDGIGYMCFDLEPEKLDEHDLINGVRAVDVTHDHKNNRRQFQLLRGFTARHTTGMY